MTRRIVLSIGTAAQRHAAAPETIVAQLPRVGVLGQIADLAAIRSNPRAGPLTTPPALVDDVATLARLEKPPKSAVKLSAPFLDQTQRRRARLR